MLGAMQDTGSPHFKHISEALWSSLKNRRSLEQGRGLWGLRRRALEGPLLPPVLPPPLETPLLEEQAWPRAEGEGPRRRPQSTMMATSSHTSRPLEAMRSVEMRSRNQLIWPSTLIPFFSDTGQRGRLSPSMSACHLEQRGIQLPDVAGSNVLSPLSYTHEVSPSIKLQWLLLQHLFAVLLRNLGSAHRDFHLAVLWHQLAWHIHPSPDVHRHRSEELCS